MKKCYILFALLLALTSGCAHAPAALPIDTSAAACAPVPGTAAALMAKMTVEEKVGQLFLAHYPEQGAIADIRMYQPGGYILFRRDFSSATPQSVRDKISACQAAKLPMLMAVDEEGGNICRISCYPAFRSEAFPSPRNLLSAGGLMLLLKTEQEKCALLSSLGLNVNMAPVCDISSDPQTYIFRRSISGDPFTAGLVAGAMTRLMQQNGIGSVAKHFPGYGPNLDTHYGISVDNRSLAQLESADLIPFFMAVEAGCGAILISHNIISAIDAERPASLSPAVIQYLRNTMKYEGVIITDDLVMKAITDVYGTQETAVMALMAGCDMVCTSEFEAQCNAVLSAVQSGQIMMEMLNSAVERVLIFKQSIGIL